MGPRLIWIGEAGAKCTQALRVFFQFRQAILAIHVHHLFKQIRGVLHTPHVSGVSPLLFWVRLKELFLDNWSRWRAGTPLRNLADKRAGY